MKLERIQIVGGQSDSPDPRSAPGAVPASAIKQSRSLPLSDNPPGLAVLMLEGTAAQTVDVQLFLLEEPDNSDAFVAPDLAARLFYSLGAAVTVTVGAAAFTRVVPGPVYYRLTNAPAANAVLKIGFVAGNP
jgi:hypothetical protein